MEAEYWGNAKGWLRDYFPTTIVRDRYDGCHSGGRWLAFADESDYLPTFLEDDDPYIWKRTTWIYGRGDTPGEAMDDLIRRVNALCEEKGEA